MRSLFAAILAFAMFAAPPCWAALSADSSTDDVLDALYEVGKDLKGFSADVKLAETDLFAQDTATRVGQVWYERRDDGNARLRVTFTKRVKDNVAQEQRIEYKLEKGWLVDRNYPRKLEVNRQVLRPGEKINLLKLGEGPFPLPIGQKREDVLKQFEVKKAAPAASDPADTVHVTLTPKPNTQFERKFASIDVWVNTKTNMPRRIETLDKHETEARTTDLDNFLVNPALNDTHFALPEIAGQEWQRRDEPFTE